MNIVFFVHHPVFLKSQSMPRYADMLVDGMRERGHNVEAWSPKPLFFRLPLPGTIRKWMGYIDQYIIFPGHVRNRLKKYSSDTLFVFTDQALGPWVSLISDRRHVIHCHDFLAQRSALGEIPENSTSWTGRQYQDFIRRGYRKGKNFISVSQKTKSDLHRFLISPPLFSDVVYNGLDKRFKPTDPHNARTLISEKTKLDLRDGYFLHVGGNQWYKNRVGVIEIYNAWRAQGGAEIPLLLLGEAPSAKLLQAHEESSFKNSIYILNSMEDKYISLAYTGALVFLFPSIAEGFGWPIAESMASGCPVITTDEAPMTEVAGDAGFFIPRRPYDKNESLNWANKAADTINKLIELPEEERKKAIIAGFINAKRFDSNHALNRIEAIYHHLLQC